MQKVRPCLYFSGIRHSSTCNLGKAYTMLLRQARRRWSPVRICGDRLMLTQFDIHLSNFGVDEHGKTVLMDFGEIGLLPESFIVHMLLSSRLVPVVSSLGLSRSSNGSMVVISSHLWITSEEKLGLDEDGNPRTKKSST